MGAGKNKLLLPINGKAVLSWTLDSAFSARSIKWIGLIGQTSDKVFFEPLLRNSPKPVKWILGGQTRQESIQKGIDSLPLDAKYVLIHDGARCLVTPKLFDDCAEQVLSKGAIIAATPVTDTIKRVDEKGVIQETPLRENLWSAQTPQAFPVDQLKQAHQKAIENGWEVTDDAALFEKLNWPVRILESSPSNIKVTTKFDLKISQAILASRDYSQ